MFQPAPTHGACLLSSSLAAGQNVEFALPRQQFHFHRLFDLRPRPFEKLLLQFAQPTPRRPHQIRYRRDGLAHLFQLLLGCDAPIHHPHSLRASVLLPDLVQKALQRWSSHWCFLPQSGGRPRNIQGCGGSETLQVHHIHPRSKRGHDSLENLITLLANCHAALYGNRRESE